MALKLSTGRVAFPIEFDNGDVQNIYFNPSDPELGTRFVAANEAITKRMEDLEIKDIELDPTGEPVNVSDFENFDDITETQAEYIKKRAAVISEVTAQTKKIIYEELDKAFDSDVSSVVFKYCSPLAIVNGEYFITAFLKAITPEIRKYVEKSTVEAQRRMNKHIGKYIK